MPRSGATDTHMHTRSCAAQRKLAISVYSCTFLTSTSSSSAKGRKSSRWSLINVAAIFRSSK